MKAKSIPFKIHRKRCEQPNYRRKIYDAFESIIFIYTFFRFTGSTRSKKYTFSREKEKRFCSELRSTLLIFVFTSRWLWFTNTLWLEHSEFQWGRGSSLFSLGKEVKWYFFISLHVNNGKVSFVKTIFEKVHSALSVMSCWDCGSRKTVSKLVQINSGIQLCYSTQKSFNPIFKYDFYSWYILHGEMQPFSNIAVIPSSAEMFNISLRLIFCLFISIALFGEM